MALDATLTKLVNAVLTSTTRPDGTKFSALPNTFKDLIGANANPSETNEYLITIRTSPDGQTASAFVQAVNSRASSANGPIDIATLATKLV